VPGRFDQARQTANERDVHPQTTVDSENFYEVGRHAFDNGARPAFPRST
jgi:hypothetical protein